MQTLLLHANSPEDLVQAAALLRQGRLVAFATETVYGLGANALDPIAVTAIFTAKQRPAWDPLIVHLASPDQLPTITLIPEHLEARISNLADHFWPGPLTLLLPRTDAIPDAVTAGRELVGVRIPAHPAAHALLAAVGLPIAAPSANTFGHTSPTTAQHVLDDLNGRIDAVLDAGPCAIGLESTVLDPTQTPMVLYRPGAITAAQLAQATGVPVHIHQPEPTAAEPASLPSPGVGIRHYAPRAELILVDVPNPADPTRSLLDRNAREIAAGRKVGLMLPDGWAVQPQTHTQAWGDWNAPETLAHNLFSGLRTLDTYGVDVILCPLPEPTEQTAALRDRLQKAARPT
jgi:L-threonylcarbamoyladenylate synthase